MNNNKSKNIQKAEDINCVLRLSDRCPVILQELLRLLRRKCVRPHVHTRTSTLSSCPQTSEESVFIVDLNSSESDPVSQSHDWLK